MWRTQLISVWPTTSTPSPVVKSTRRLSNRSTNTLCKMTRYNGLVTVNLTLSEVIRNPQSAIASTVPRTVQSEAADGRSTRSRYLGLGATRRTSAPKGSARPSPPHFAGWARRWWAEAASTGATPSPRLPPVGSLYRERLFEPRIRPGEGCGCLWTPPVPPASPRLASHARPLSPRGALLPQPPPTPPAAAPHRLHYGGVSPAGADVSVTMRTRNAEDSATRDSTSSLVICVCRAMTWRSWGWASMCGTAAAEMCRQPNTFRCRSRGRVQTTCQ